MNNSVILPDRKEALRPPSNREERERVKQERDRIRREITQVEAELRALKLTESGDLEWRRGMSRIQERKTRLQERIVQLNAWLAGAPLLQPSPIGPRKWERRLENLERAAELRAELGLTPESPTVDLLRALHADVCLLLAKGLVARSLVNQGLLEAIRAHLESVG